MDFAIDTAGLHPSTELGLEALSLLHGRAHPRNILDMGCGNGLLSLVCAQIWEDCRVLAVDIAPHAVADTQAMLESYQLYSRITVVRSDRFAHSLIDRTGPYDLIIANMLDQWLKEMAMDIKNHLKPDGYCILSGMLAWLAADTKLSFSGLGFEIIEEISIPPWQCTILRRT